MPSRDVYRTGVYGLATKPGSADDATEYKSTKAAEVFYAALLDPNATTIRRKSGTKWPKLQHTLVYDADFVSVRAKDVTSEMHLVTPEKSIVSPEQWVHAYRRRLNAKSTFHAQISHKSEVCRIEGKAHMTMTQKRKTEHRANVDGVQHWNKDRDW
jgi:hypothetical protein